MLLLIPDIAVIQKSLIALLDEFMEELEGQKAKEKRLKMYKRFQQVIQDDEPVTFLYLVPYINAYNKKIDNVNITHLNSITHCWEWKIKR